MSTEGQEVVSNPRNEMEEQLAEKRHASEELVPLENADGDVSDVPAEVPAEVPADEVPADPVVPVVETPAAPELVTIKVDGQEIQVPKDKVDAEGGVEALQMKLAAAKRLEDARIEAAHIREEAQREVAAKAKPAEEQPDVAALVEKIRFGSETEASEAIKQLTKPNQLSQDAVAPMIQAEIAKSDAVRSFKTDFPEIVKDPFLSRLALDLEVNARQNGDRRSHHDLYQEIGKRISDWKGGIAGSFKDKQEKKATVTNIPQAKAKAVLPDEPRPMSRKEILDEERRARKQG